MPMMNKFNKYNKEWVNREQLNEFYQYSYIVVKQKFIEDTPRAPQPLPPEIELKIQEIERRQRAKYGETGEDAEEAVGDDATSAERIALAVKSGK